MRSRLPLLIVGGSALLLRVVYLLEIRDNPFFETPVIDAEFYHEEAVLRAGSGFLRSLLDWGRPVDQMPPLYPVLLSLLYRLLGVHVGAAHIAQILLGTGSALWTTAIGSRLGGHAVGLVAGLVVGTSQALLFLEGDLLATPLVVFLDLGAVFFLVRFLQDGENKRDLLGAGLALGFSALAFPLVLFWVPFLLFWMIRRRRRGVRQASWLLLAILLPLTPVTLRNVIAGGELVLVSANGGINFYMGNNPDMRRTSTLRPGPEWRRMQEKPMREAGIVPADARDRWFLQQGIRFWFEEPLRAFEHTIEKAVLLVHDHEIMRDFDFYYFRDHYSRLLRLPGLSFAWLLGLALVGLVQAWKGTPSERLLRLFLLGNALAVVLFFVTARYRAPLLPILAVFAARGIVWMKDRVQQRDLRSLGLAVLLLVGTVVFSWIDFYGVDRVDAVEARYRIATTFEKKGEFEEALARYRAVLQEEPDHVLARARAGVCAQRLGRSQDAVDLYEGLLERHPSYPDAAVNLGHLAWQHGQVEAAEHYYRMAITADPYLSQAHAAYGVFLVDQGRYPEAVRSLEQALRYDPTWDALRLDLARAHLGQGDLDAAWREIDRVTRVLPSSDRLELVRGDAHLLSGRPGEARRAWERGLDANPANKTLRDRLQNTTP